MDLVLANQRRLRNANRRNRVNRRAGIDLNAIIQAARLLYSGGKTAAQVYNYATGSKRKKAFASGSTKRRGGAPSVQYVAGNSTKKLMVSRRRRPKRLPRNVGKYSAPDMYLYTHTGQMSVGSNVQVYTGLHCGERAQDLAGRMKVHPYNTTPAVGQIDTQSLDQARMKYRMIKKVFLKNNHNFKCKLYVWDAFCKDRTGQGPQTILSQAIATRIVPGSTVASTKLGVWPADGGWFFKKTYKLGRMKAIELAPGEACYLNYSSGWKNYVQEHVDDHPSDIRPGMHHFFILLKGDLAHNSTASTVGITEAKLDYYIEARTITCQKYSGDNSVIENLDSSLSTLTAPVQIDTGDPGTETAIGN